MNCQTNVRPIFRRFTIFFIPLQLSCDSLAIKWRCYRISDSKKQRDYEEVFYPRHCIGV